jgi:hormone-sensitive lipase
VDDHLSASGIRYFLSDADIHPQNIILVGDSAGGNIIASLTGLLIKLKYPTPKGIVLIYPTLNLTFSSYSPSVLSSLDDMILPHTFLKLCLSCYVPEECRA